MIYALIFKLIPGSFQVPGVCAWVFYCLLRNETVSPAQ